MTAVRALASIALLGAAATATTPSLAATYLLEFQGTVTAVSGIAGATVGDPITGRLSYADGPDGNPSANIGAYAQAALGWQFSAGSFAKGDAMERVVVFNDAVLGLYNPGDGIEYQGRADGSFDAAAGTFFYVSVLGEGTALSSTALPTAAPDLAAFASRTIFWGVDTRLSPGGPYLVGELTAVSLVPEAATPAMLLAGLALLAAMRRRAA